MLRTSGKRPDRPGGFVEPTVLNRRDPKMRADDVAPLALRRRPPGRRTSLGGGGTGQFLVVGLGGAVYSADPERAQESPTCSYRHGVGQQPDGLDGRPAVRGTSAPASAGS